MKTSVAIVTGASQGIGRSTALRLAKGFSNLVLAARNGEALEEVSTLVKKAGAEPLALPLDLREPATARFLVDETLQQFGRIDAVVNIAGAVPQIDLLEMTDAQWEDGLALKLHGAPRITVQAWNGLKESKGSVVFTSRNSAQAPKSAYAAVAAINAAIVALARAFAERGIKSRRWHRRQTRRPDLHAERSAPARAPVSTHGAKKRNPISSKKQSVAANST